VTFLTHREGFDAVRLSAMDHPSGSFYSNECKNRKLSFK